MLPIFAFLYSRTKSLTCFLLSDFCLQVLRVHIGKMLLVFWRLTLPAAETAAEETAAAGEKTTAHHKRLNTNEGRREPQYIYTTCIAT